MFLSHHHKSSSRVGSTSTLKSVKSLVTAIVLSGALYSSCDLLDKGELELNLNQLYGHHILYGHAGSQLTAIDLFTGEILDTMRFSWLEDIYPSDVVGELYVSTFPKTYHVNFRQKTRSLLTERKVNFQQDNYGNIYVVTDKPDASKDSVGIIIDRQIQWLGEVSILDKTKGFRNFTGLSMHDASNVFSVSVEGRLVKTDFVSQTVETLFPDRTFFHHYDFSISKSGKYLYAAGGPIIDLTKASFFGGIPVYRTARTQMIEAEGVVITTDPSTGHQWYLPAPSNLAYVVDYDKGEIINTITIPDNDLGLIGDVQSLQEHDEVMVFTNIYNAYAILDYSRKKVIFQQAYPDSMLYFSLHHFKIQKGNYANN